MSRPGSLADVARATWRGYDRDSGILLAGGLAFFGALSLSPLLVVGVSIAQILLGKAAVSGVLIERLAPVVGAPAANAIQQTVLHTMASGSSGTAAAIAVVVAVVGAGGLILQVRASLDIVSGVPKPSSLRGLLAEVLRASMTVFVLGMFVVATATVWSLASSVTGGASERAAAYAASAATSALLFGLLVFGYRFLTLGGMPWAPAAAGSAVAVIIAAASTLGLYAYLALGFAASAYGAAASFFVFLLWLWFLAIGFVVGAELSHAWQELRSGAPTARG